MSLDFGTVCWYTCSHRGGMSLRNQIHSMLQQWHVCNTFHFLPNTLKYAEISRRNDNAEIVATAGISIPCHRNRNLNYKGQKFAMMLSSLDIHKINGWRISLVFFWAVEQVPLWLSYGSSDLKSEGWRFGSQLGEH